MLYFVIEKKPARWKSRGHLWICGGRAEEVPWSWWVLEDPKATMGREIPEEVEMLTEDWVDYLWALIETGVLIQFDTTNANPPAEVTIFSLNMSFRPLEDDEISGIVKTKKQIIDMLSDEFWYLQFRPLVIEALALHFWITLFNEEMHVYIENRNYASKPVRVIQEIISVLWAWK